MHIIKKGFSHLVVSAMLAARFAVVRQPQID